MVSETSISTVLMLAGLIHCGVAHADTVISAQTYNYHDIQIDSVSIENIVLHVETVQTTDPDHTQKKHFFVTSQLHSTDASTQQINYDLTFVLKNPSGRVVTLAYANNEALYAQQIDPCVADPGYLLPVTAGPVGLMDIQLTLASIRHHDPKPLSPAR
jgi:hypothetical protein